MLQTVLNLLFVNTFEQGPFDRYARSNVNAAWGAVTMEVLARLGISTVVISPGSRSAPLTLAASNNTKLNTLVVLDERMRLYRSWGAVVITPSFNLHLWYSCGKLHLP